MRGLPTSLTVAGKEYAIRSDYRPCLDILTCMTDPDIRPEEKWEVLMQILYIEEIPAEHMQEALDKAVWFLNCGQEPGGHSAGSPLYDWEQDEQMIFSAVNKVAGKEIRLEPYVHYWTFLGYFQEIGEGLFSSVVNIRSKKKKHKKLEKHEKEFYRENKDLIDLKRKRTAEEQTELDSVRQLLGR